MKTCEYDGEPRIETRSHPWTDSGRAGGRYYDLTAEPALIRSSLEDFLPWVRYPAVELFYSLLERLNHSRSVLETNDCAFSGPSDNQDLQFRKPIACSGRLMVLYRELELNASEERLSWLKTALHYQLAPLDPKFQTGVIGTTLVPVRYLGLTHLGRAALGQQLMISFWAFGDSEADSMRNLARLLKNLSLALRGVMARIAAS